ncbi:MAG: hypothetical protein WD059_08335 [Balneolaceae bacterium]
MKKLIVLFLFIPITAQAQIVGPVSSPENSIRQNGVSTIATYGDTVWISPALNRNIGNAAEWYSPENADSVVGGIGRVFSLALGRDTVVAGLGFSRETEDGSVPAAYGYYTSTDGGILWDYHSFLLDPQTEDDTTFLYGGEIYNRLRITVPEQSPPYDIDYAGNVILSVNWASGLLRSSDFGESWERIVIPPYNVQNLTPDEDDYFWITCLSRSSDGGCSETENKYNSIEDDNLKGFSIHIDSQNRVWFGSAGGINVSHNALTAPTDSISWKHVSFDNASDGLTGDWIISIQEEPETGRIWMTNWIASDQNESHSIVYTEDEGETFTQMLVGEKINDIGFKDGHVFAAGDNGLFISPDGGATWIKSPQIKSPNTFIKPSAAFQSVATTTDRVWIGTDDGIASTDDYGKMWEITRVNFPLEGGNLYDPEARNVESYAYPNPFSPSVYEVVRIKFEVQQQGNVKVRIFDFGMNLVREVENDSFTPGTYEAVWDGYDNHGRKVANAPYIYVIESGDKKISGKILVVD